jgi:type IV pilus assembly protein PilA
LIATFVNRIPLEPTSIAKFILKISPAIADKGCRNKFLIEEELSFSSQEQSGFTLIELLVVVALIGIIAAIALPQINSYRVRGFNATAQSDLRNMISAQEAYFVDQQIYLSCVNDTCNEPALPGMRVSEGTNIRCNLIGAGEYFTCSSKHQKGVVTYLYDSETSTLSEL